MLSREVWRARLGSVLVGFAFVKILLQLTVSSTVQASAAWKTKISLKSTNTKTEGKHEGGSAPVESVSVTKTKPTPGSKPPFCDPLE